MNDIEERLQRYRPSGPPADLRERLIVVARRRSLEESMSVVVREWVPTAAALVMTLLFYWLAAHERQVIGGAFTPMPPIDQAVAVLIDLEEARR